MTTELANDAKEAWDRWNANLSDDRVSWEAIAEYFQAKGYTRASPEHAQKIYGETQTLFKLETDDFGTIRVDRWPEGIVFWVGGQIAWKSWAKATEKSARPIVQIIQGNEGYTALCNDGTLWGGRAISGKFTWHPFPPIPGDTL